MNLTQLRKQAKELKAAVAAGDATAIDRVLAAHPKYVGRPADRLDITRFALRDAQLVLAREHGHTSWAALTTATLGETTARSIEPRTGLSAAAARAMLTAGRRGDDAADVEHLLLALLRPPRPTLASEVLHHLGMDAADIEAALPTRDRPRADPHTTISSVALHACDAFARALALTEGLDRPEDHHLLIAALYEGRPMQGGWYHRSIDPDEIYDALRDRGVTVPTHRPPTSETARGPMGPRLYVAAPHAAATTQALSERYPPQPGHPRWGLNHSRWRPGFVWFDAEDEIDLATIARETLPPGTPSEMVPLMDAVRAEMAADVDG